MRDQRFDPQQSRYRPRIYRWFPENVAGSEFYWPSQGCSLDLGAAEAGSILDYVHQRHADLLQAIEHIE